jgi:hypothetical protein
VIPITVPGMIRDINDNCGDRIAVRSQLQDLVFEHFIDLFNGFVVIKLSKA